MIIRTYKQELRRWASTDNTVFEVIATYNPNEEQDPWVKYRNVATGQEYTCRQEAFESRFSPLAD